MKNPVLSLFGPSIRPNLWGLFYNSVEQATSLPFEIVFAGPPCRVKVKMPDNFTYIETNVKPIQCWQITAIKCRGEVMTLVADDLVFTPGSLDEAYDLYLKSQNYKTIIALRMLLKGVDQTHTCVLPRDSSHPNKNSLLVPGGLAILSRKLFLEVGGYDRSFLFSDANFDFFLRAHFEFNAEFMWANFGADEDIGWASGTHALELYQQGLQKYDVDRLAHLWYPNGVLLSERNEVFDPFDLEDENFNKISQGIKHIKWD